MHIQQNESIIDRFARIFIGALLIIIATYLSLSAVLATLFLIVGAYLLLTALAGACPAYKLFGFKTGQ